MHVHIRTDPFVTLHNGARLLVQDTSWPFQPTWKLTLDAECADKCSLCLGNDEPCIPARCRLMESVSRRISHFAHMEPALHPSM
jgi:hypothetical protein